MSDGINIEIIGNFKERYPARIHSLSGENELIVTFDDNPETPCKVPLTSVLLLSKPSETANSCDWIVGCDVLAFHKMDESNANSAQFKDVKLSHAWWPAKIEKLKGCFAVIQLLNKENDLSTDIVELTSLRQIHDSRPLLRSDIRVHEMAVSDDLCGFCEHYDIRGDLVRWCGPALIVNFDKVNKKLQIFSTDQEVVRRASLLDASFMRLLRQKKLIHTQKDELTKRLNDTIKNQYTEEFTVAEELMGLAIGSQGSNIKKAREIEGVINIDLDDFTHTFVISAQTQEAVKAARAQLEYMKKIFYVPMDIVSKVIGKNGNQIQDIIDQSGIMRVRVVEGPDLNHWKDDDNASMLTDHIPFIFVGSANSIRDACLLLEFSIDHHREMDRLQKERDDIHREIRNNQANLPHKFFDSGERDDDQHFNSSGGGGGSSQPYNRGYNSHISGGGGGGTRGNKGGRGGGGGYKATQMSSSDVDQRNDSYNDESGPQMYGRGNGRVGPYKRGGGGSGGFRQGSLPPPSVNGQHNGNRRYQQQQQYQHNDNHEDNEDTGDNLSAGNAAATESDGGRQGVRGGGRGGRGYRGRPYSGGGGGSGTHQHGNGQPRPDRNGGGAPPEDARNGEELPAEC